ncbi:hypothetical protein bpmyx0001_5030 [Bacillus pseudomycoides DSM 12442]|nr:hypothetical protein bpmyx0001_5030 [Bacillus pseudomycoides DSM 12442]
MAWDRIGKEFDRFYAWPNALVHLKRKEVFMSFFQLVFI